MDYTIGEVAQLSSVSERTLQSGWCSHLLRAWRWAFPTKHTPLHRGPA